MKFRNVNHRSINTMLLTFKNWEEDDRSKGGFDLVFTWSGQTEISDWV